MKEEEREEEGRKKRVRKKEGQNEKRPEMRMRE